MSRITKSKIYKPFIALLVAVILVFSFEVNKPKAIVPILAWGAWAIAGIVAEEFVEMGIKHVTSDGKAKSKSKSKKIADEIFGSYDSYDFDFLKSNPTKKADGSLVFTPSAQDRAKIARKIADEFLEDIGEGVSSNAGSYSDDGATLHVSWYSATTIASTDAKNFLEYMFLIDTESIGTSSNLYLTSKVTGARTLVRDYPHTEGSNIYNFKANHNSMPFMTGRPYTPYQRDGCVSMEKYPYLDSPLVCDIPTQTAYIKILDYLEQVSVAGGLMIPKTLKNVYPAPYNMSDDMVLPNSYELSNKPVVLKDIYPVSESDVEYSWETVNNDYETDNSITNRMEQNVDTYLENGDINNNTYNTQTINNYYTDSSYPTKAGDVTVIVDVDVPPPVVIDDDDDGSTGDLPPQAEVLDRTLISYAKQTYDYLGDSIDGAITSMRDITDDASGLVDYLDTSFRWLPAEWRALFGSAFILGVFAHFMRR